MAGRVRSSGGRRAAGSGRNHRAGSMQQPGGQAAPLLFWALLPGSQLNALLGAGPGTPSWAGGSEEVWTPWLRTCPD